MFRAVLLVAVAGCFNPVIAPHREVVKDTRPERMAHAEEETRRADALGASHPFASRIHRGFAIQWGGGKLDRADALIAPLGPEIAVSGTGEPCPILARQMLAPRAGDPHRHVDVQLVVGKCSIVDTSDAKESVIGWQEKVVDRIEVKRGTRRECNTRWQGGHEVDVVVTDLDGTRHNAKGTTLAGEAGECHDVPYENREEVFHMETRSGKHRDTVHDVSVTIDGSWTVTHGGITRSGKISTFKHDISRTASAEGPNSGNSDSPITPDSVVASGLYEVRAAIEHALDEVLAADTAAAIAAEEAAARAATDPDEAEEHWARSVALGGTGGPLAKLAVDGTSAHWALTVTEHPAPEFVTPYVYDERVELTRYTPSLVKGSWGILGGGYEMLGKLATPAPAIGGDRAALASVRFGRSLIATPTAHGGSLADAAVMAGGLGYRSSGDGAASSKLAWTVEGSYALGLGWRNGHGSGFLVGGKGIARAAKLGDAEVGYLALPLFARLELQLPNGALAIEGTGVSLTGDKVWAASVDLVQQAPTPFKPRRVLTFRVERADVRGHVDTGNDQTMAIDAFAPKLTSFFIGYGADIN